MIFWRVGLWKNETALFQAPFLFYMRPAGRTDLLVKVQYRPGKRHAGPVRKVQDRRDTEPYVWQCGRTAGVTRFSNIAGEIAHAQI
jgi:hypothetical protein